MWDKVPVEKTLKEVKEITTDGSMQELLHKFIIQAKFSNELWTREQSFPLSVTNWAGQSVMIQKGIIVGSSEPVSQVG